MSDKYILDHHRAVPCDDLIKWATWFETADRKVARWEGNGVVISTVFLGLDHAYGDGEPMIFETMVFPVGTMNERETERYSTWHEAEEGHRAMVEKYTKPC